jgi:hypothetical protein
VLDEFLPSYDFSERHETFVAAAPKVTMAATRQMTPRDVPLLLLLLSVRSVPYLLSRRQPMISPRGSILEQGARVGFVTLADRPEELVLGVVGKFWRPDSGLLTLPAQDFIRFSDPGWAKAAISFEARPSGSGCRLSTETRIQGTDASARRKFGLYWLLIRPGSSAIRAAWLRAIRKRAERR